MVIPAGRMGTDQLKVTGDEVTDDENNTSACWPEQIACGDEGDAMTSGIGFTLTVYSMGLSDEQVLVDGVMLNTTSTGSAVVFEITSWISAIPEVLIMVIPDGTTGTDQLNATGV